MQRKGNPFALLVGMIQSLWRTVWRFLRNLGIKLLYDPAIPVLGIYLEITKIQNDICTPTFTAAHNTRTWKQPRCPSIGE